GNFPANSASVGTVFFYLLPYLEYENVFNNSMVNGVASTNNPLAGSDPPIRPYGVVIPTYLCPSDPSAPSGHGRGTGLNTLATANYAANLLVFTASAGIPKAFRNGTSNTILYLEHYQVCNGDWFYWGVTLPPKPPGFGIPAAGAPYQLAPPAEGGSPP